MLKEIGVRLVEPEEEPRFQGLLQAHHYLGALRKIGQTLWYVATYRGEWVALLIFSAAALKLVARDQWIGWSYRQQYARLPLLANNTRFLVLPAFQRPNVASRTLALCEHRVSQDWNERYGHPIVLLETFVDSRHRGTLYLDVALSSLATQPPPGNATTPAGRSVWRSSSVSSDLAA